MIWVRTQKKIQHVQWRPAQEAPDPGREAAHRHPEALRDPQEAEAEDRLEVSLRLRAHGLQHLRQPHPQREQHPQRRPQECQVREGRSGHCEFILIWNNDSNTRSGTSSLFRNGSTKSFQSGKSGLSFRSTKSGQSTMTTLTTLSSVSGSSSSSGHKRKRGERQRRCSV